MIVGGIYCIQTKAIKTLFGEHAYKFGKHKSEGKSSKRDLNKLYQRYCDETNHYGHPECEIFYYFEVGSTFHAERNLFEALQSQGFRVMNTGDDPIRKKKGKKNRDLEIYEILPDRFREIKGIMAMVCECTSLIRNYNNNFKYFHKNFDSTEIEMMLKKKDDNNKITEEVQKIDDDIEEVQKKVDDIEEIQEDIVNPLKDAIKQFSNEFITKVDNGIGGGLERSF